MSDILSGAVEAINAKMGGNGFDGSAKFVIEGEGSIVIDGSGASQSDADTDVTLTANADVFQAIMSGDQNATSAFMTGKLKLDGDMGTAMKLAGVLG